MCLAVARLFQRCSKINPKLILLLGLSSNSPALPRQNLEPREQEEEIPSEVTEEEQVEVPEESSQSREGSTNMYRPGRGLKLPMK